MKKSWRDSLGRYRLFSGASGTSWAFLATMGLAVGFSVGQAQAAALPAVRIMPLGDSITDGYSVRGGYRAPLYGLLTNAGYAVDFTGSTAGNSTDGLPDPDHEGHNGAQIDQIHAGAVTWLDQTDDPDIILLLIGTNDYGQGYDTAHATNRLENLIALLTTYRPHAKILVANLLLRTDSVAIDAAIRTTFNPFVPGVVARQASLGRQVYFLNMRSKLVTSDLGDQLHPNLTGYRKMATNWFGAITNLISPSGTTNPPALTRAYAGPGLTNVLLTFSKPVHDGATNLSNFIFDGDLTALSAGLDPASKRVITLTTSLQITSRLYRVTVKGVGDRTPANTLILPESSISWVANPVDTELTYVGGAFANVREAACYSLVYSLNISNTATYGATGVPYEVDDHINVGPFRRVAYYLELEPRVGPPRFVWASMSAFTLDASKIGVPTLASGAFFQQAVTNLNVESNLPGIVTGVGLNGGNLEFWPINYAARNSAGVPGASGQAFDWGDQSLPGGYGSMQVHNSAARQTLFAFNRWNAGDVLDIGIGNNVSAGQPDWTFAQNANSYSNRLLQIFVLTGSPQPIRARLARRGQELTLSWAGGSGPFQVQQSTVLALTNSWWNVGAPVCASQLVLTNLGSGAFFRIVEQ